MRDINPLAILLVAIGTVAGALFGHVLIGLMVALLVVLFATAVNP